MIILLLIYYSTLKCYVNLFVGDFSSLRFKKNTLVMEGLIEDKVETVQSMIRHIYLNATDENMTMHAYIRII